MTDWVVKRDPVYPAGVAVDCGDRRIYVHAFYDFARNSAMADRIVAAHVAGDDAEVERLVADLPRLAGLHGQPPSPPVSMQDAGFRGFPPRG